MRRRDLVLFAALGGALWLVVIASIAVVVSFMGWLNFLLAVLVLIVGAFVAHDVFAEETDDDDLGVPDWVSRR